MTYKPLTQNKGGSINTVSVMPKKGINLRDLPQLLDPQHALKLQNYYITGEGGLEKRGGLELLTKLIWQQTDANLVAYWRFDEGYGATTADSSVNTNTGTIADADWTAGLTDHCLEFDGADSIITVGDDASIQDIFDGGGSIAFWIKPSSDGENNLGMILNKTNWFAQVSDESNGKVKVKFTQNFSVDKGEWETPVIQLNEWHHVVINYDSSDPANDPAIYIDGETVTVTENDTPSGAFTTDVGDDLIIGNNAALTRTFDGLIDEVRIYTAELTFAQIGNLYLTQKPVTMAKKWTDNYYVFGYDNSVVVYDKARNTQIPVKLDFVQEGFDGAKYGNYFFVASPGDKIGRMSFTLNYDNQTVNFTVGDIVTGGTSGAKALILTDADAGATGTLTLGDITGTFADNEEITDPTGGTADVNGLLNITYTEIAAAPKARVIKVVDTRLFAGDLEENRTAVKYCDVDTGTNPPFNTWTAGTDATQSGLLSYRNAGIVNLIKNLGNIIVVGCDDGKWAFTIDTIDSAGTLSKVDNTVMYSLDAGMDSALQTEDGLFYTNSLGLWQLVALGQQDIKFSDQESLVSTHLGNHYFDDADFTDSDIIMDSVNKQLLVTFRDDSSANNQILVYNTEHKAFGVFTGWNISRFINDEGVLYGAGANSAKVWQLLATNDDDGNDIWYEFVQELNVGQLWTRKTLLGQYILGELNPLTNPLITFSIYNKDGVFIEDKLKLDWTPGVTILGALGYGEASWGDPFGGGLATSDTTECFAGSKQRIADFQRLRVKISGHDKVAHKIKWLSVLTREKADIRKRNLTNIS